jgi:hypothetical protein
LFDVTDEAEVLGSIYPSTRTRRSSRRCNESANSCCSSARPACRRRRSPG